MLMTNLLVNLVSSEFDNHTSGVSIKMPDSTELEKNHNNTRIQIREDSEYVRLVKPNELKVADAHAEPQTQTTRRSLIWWIKAIIWFMINLIISKYNGDS